MKKLWKPIALFILGVFLLLLSVINGVDVIPSHMSSISNDSVVTVEIDGEIICYGFCEFSEAEITIKLRNRNGATIKKEKVYLKDISSFSTKIELDKNELRLSGGLWDMTVEVDSIRFDNTPLLIISFIIIIGAAVYFVIEMKKSKGQIEEDIKQDN